MSTDVTHVLACYDGSEEAGHAITEAARLLAGGRMTVLYAWRSGPETTARYGAPAAWGSQEEFDRDQAHAHEIAAKGVEIARGTGLAAEPLTAHGPVPAWAVILRVAHQVAPDIIVMGTRSLHGIKAVVLGSTSHNVVNQAHRPTLVIPMPFAPDDAGEAESAEPLVRVDPS
jgi:nucleotide-binding universal stress UspA family protein